MWEDNGKLLNSRALGQIARSIAAIPKNWPITGRHGCLQSDTNVVETAAAAH